MASGRLRLHGQAAECGQDLNAVDLAVAVGVFLELGVAGPVPGILDGPPIPHVLQECFRCGPETRDVVTGLIDRLAIAPAFAAHRQDCGAAGPVLHRPPLWGGHAAQRPGEVVATLALAVAALEQRLAAVGQPITDDTKASAAAVFDGNQEVGATLLEVEENGRLACSASACTSRPSSLTRSRSSRRALISLLLSVA